MQTRLQGELIELISGFNAMALRVVVLSEDESLIKYLKNHERFVGLFDAFVITPTLSLARCDAVIAVQVSEGLLQDIEMVLDGTPSYLVKVF